ncbi:hypothetical protein QQ41_03085 [Streptococcus equi subsp. zooepidemicus]|nr:hypothetical protein QQ41_03085 [Streptococcus equi subsp. zooepidemicus]
MIYFSALRSPLKVFKAYYLATKTLLTIMTIGGLFVMYLTERDGLHATKKAHSFKMVKFLAMCFVYFVLPIH